MIDSHIHIYSSEYDEDRTQLIEEAQNVGVAKMYLPAIDSSYIPKMLQMEEQYPVFMQLMMGLHPCYVKPDSYKRELEIVQEYLSQRAFAAVGEIGIDLYWDKSTLAIQQEAFRTQIEWAKQHDLPIIIHTRESFDETFEILDSLKDDKLKGIFHCFTGTKEQAEHAIDLGFKLGIGGVLTFKNGKIDTFLNEIPLEHIVLETDGPYLAPTPYRGKRNEPKYLLNIAEKLASIYQKPLSEIDTITSENALSIFKS